MTTIIKNLDVRTIEAGLYVERAAANLPATAAGNIFTISGGRILLVALYGEVTTAIQAQLCTVKFTSTPTTGSAIDLSAVSASISGLEVGGHIAVPNPPAAGTAAVVSNAGYVNLQNVFTILPIGNISITTSATNTGQMKWGILYVPLDAGSQVVAA